MKKLLMIASIALLLGGCTQTQKDDAAKVLVLMAGAALVLGFIAGDIGGGGDNDSYGGSCRVPSDRASDDSRCGGRAASER